MSMSKYVAYGDVTFWAYDVALCIFLKFLIDRASLRTEPEHADWLSACIQNWQVIAVVNDYGLHFDERLSEEQIKIILCLIDRTCCELGKRDSIPAQEIESWNILDGEGIFARGDSEFPTAPVIELGRVIQELLRGTLAPVPKSTQWFFDFTRGKRR